MKMRPRLEIHCDGVLTFWIEDPRTDDTDTITLTISGPGGDQFFPWLVGDDGQPVNPWKISLDFLNSVKVTNPEPPAAQPETWRDRPPLL